jgi:glutathione S-transferase
MSAIRIYGVYRSRGSRNYWLCNEMGREYESVPVIQVYRLADPSAKDAQINTQSPAFLKINPAGQIPSMQDGDLILHESLAINLYLAKKYGGALGPKDIAEDGLMTMWSLWAATSCEPHTIEILYNRIGKPPAERDTAKAEAAEAAMISRFAVLDKALAKDGWLVGGRFTVADINVSEIFRYALPAAQLFAKAPNVKAWIERCHARKGFKDMMAKRDAEPA